MLRVYVDIRLHFGAVKKRRHVMERVQKLDYDKISVLKI